MHDRESLYDDFDSPVFVTEAFSLSLLCDPVFALITNEKTHKMVAKNKVYKMSHTELNEMITPMSLILVCPNFVNIVHLDMAIDLKRILIH